MAGLELKSIEKAYGSYNVLQDIDLSINDGEFIVFVGPSGCGKSTLLRMIAGLENITGGTISIGGKVVNDLSAPQRGISMVFQSYALYPHMTVRQNMSFGLELANRPKEEIRQRVDEAASILKLDDYLDRMPRALSGGQRQRVAIGRAIVREPEVFLFDEPLSNLDAALRGQTRVEIARLHTRLKTTMIYVTHDQTEAMTLADRIVVLNGGHIEQVGTPLELYQTPQNAFVAGFIGGQTMNFLPVSKGKLAVAGAHFSGKLHPDAHLVGVRPEHLVLAETGAGDISGTIDVIEEFGEFILYYLLVDSGDDAPVSVIFKSQIADLGQAGDRLSLTIPTDHLHQFDKDGRALSLGA